MSIHSETYQIPQTVNNTEWNKIESELDGMDFETMQNEAAYENQNAIDLKSLKKGAVLAKINRILNKEH